MSRLISILKTNNIIKVDKNQTLAQALSKLTTSHDAAFVFDNERFLGLISPYYTIIRCSYPANTKIINCLYHPPKIYLNTPIKKVVKFLIQTKVHYLPVFDYQEKFVGIVSARRLLKFFFQSNFFKISIKDFLKKKKKPLFLITIDDQINKALNIFREKKISKLVVVDNDMRLRGVLSYYDLINFLISPQGSARRGDRSGAKTGFSRYLVSQFAKTYVLTLGIEEILNKVVRLIIEKKIGSVVIVDKNNHPINIITTKDLLEYFIQGPFDNKLEIVTKNISQKNQFILDNFFKKLNFFIFKNQQIKKAKVLVKEEKEGGLFEVVLSLFPFKGQVKVIKKEGKSLVKTINPLTQVLKIIFREKTKN